MFWAVESADRCRRRGVEFTLVVVPEAFQVDSRMREQWLPLTDMRQLTKPCGEAAGRLCRRAVAAGLDVLDLHPVLQDIPGTYLNLDGHWSDKGVEIVSDALVRHLRRAGD